jgi:hypothetical protein
MTIFARENALSLAARHIAEKIIELDVALDRAEAAARATEDRLGTLSAALADREAQIATLERDWADFADKRARAETSGELEKRRDRFLSAHTALDQVLAEFVGATAAVAEVCLDAQGLLIFSKSARDELHPAVDLVVREVSARVAATLDGRAPAVLPKQQPLQIVPPAPKPTVACFALRHIAWSDLDGMLRSVSANTGNVELPEAAAERGLKSGAVILMSDQRVKQLARSRAELFVPDPARCEMLDDSIVPPDSRRPAKHSAFPLPPGEAFTPLDRGPAYAVKVPPAPAVAARSITDASDE